MDKQEILAEIEKGQQLAGHFPSAEALEMAEQILDGKLELQEARRILLEKHTRKS